MNALWERLKKKITPEDTGTFACLLPPSVSFSHLGTLELMKAPLTLSERIIELAATKYQNNSVYYYPAIPHHHIRAAFKAAHCTLEDDDVRCIAFLHSFIPPCMCD